MKRLFVTVLICIMCFCDVVPAMAASGALYDSDSTGASENAQEQTDSQDDTLKDTADSTSSRSTDNRDTSKYGIAAQAGNDSPAVVSEDNDGIVQKNLPEGELLFITLAENHNYRWNVNDSAEKNSVVHLDDSSGKNCNFRLKHVGEEWYGIKHIKDNGVDRYADIEDKSKDKGKKLHLWEDSDDEVSGNDHRQFAFYYVGLDDKGNEQFYIKNRKSGLWMGYEDTDKNGKASYGDKIIQTDSSHRKLWIVTPETVPMVGGEMKNPATGSDAHVYCEMFKKGTIDAINRNNDAAVNSTELHFYEMGTSSKWKLEYIDKYAAYEIHAVTDGEADRHNKVWDVDGESGSDNAWIWLWSDQSKDKNENTSQLWRFIKQNDGSYKIMNVRSGKYVNCTDSGVLLQKSSGTDIELDIISGSTPSINFDYSQDWMSVVPDEALLSSVNIPGSHDTGTAAIIQDAVPTISLTSCQKYYYGEQLNVGVRSFDVRCNATKNNAKPGDVNIIHGSELWQCYDRDGSKLTLEDILDDSVRFLKDDKHKTEALVIMLKPDAGSTEGLARAVGDFIKNNGDYVYKGGGIPSMGEARGKIVFIRRYDIDTDKYDPADDGLKEEWFGINLSDWDTNSYGEYKYAINIYDKDGTKVYAQDAYNEFSYGKWDYVEGTMKQTTGSNTSHAIPSDAWIYNYTSCAVGFPLGLTRYINPKLFYDDANCIDNRRLGMVMMNFVDRPMSRLIYETNKSDSKFYATKATFPSSISITYGDTLSEARMTWPKDADGNLQDGNGTWKFEDENYVPTAEDISKHKTFKLTYTPDDTRLKPVTKEVLITSFEPKYIEVTADDKEITYGDPLPELTYSVDESQLVNGDTAEDLDIELELMPDATDGKVGSYQIKGRSLNKNYNVKLKDGTLKISKKTVSIQWSDTRNLVYTGDPVNVTAELTGVLDGDQCKAVVEPSGSTEWPTEPSWNDTDQAPTKYTATVTGLTGKDSGNYQLPDDDSIDYYIRRDTPDADDYAFPQKAVLTYGQKLSEANLVGASGDGEFIFMKDNNNAGDAILNAGTYEYDMIYKPKDSSTEHPMPGKVTVEVLPKQINVEAVNKSKTYGDATPKLEYSIDTSQLVNGDKEDSLGLTLTAGAGDDQYCNAGKYKIEKKDCTNGNYDVTVKPAVLTVSRKPAEIKWPSEKSYPYSGKAVNITENVSVSNLVNNDICDVAVLGGVAVNTGDYTAVAVALSNRNYRLPENKENRVYDYEIVKADPVVTFPTSATITYGESLDQAELSGQSGDGTFAFEDGSKMINTSDSGKKQRMIFTPKDTDNYNSIRQEVTVTVNKKPLDIKADDKQKTYGQETPELTWYMDESQLVAGDSIDEFDLDLKVSGEGNSQTCDVGGYDITGTVISQNENYDIRFSNGTLKVDPLMVSFKWNIPYDLKVGDPAPTAQIMNLVQADDDCRITVESDGTANASWTEGSDKITVYDAEITGLEGADKFNYTLPDEELTRQYLVLRTSADCSMPKAAVMTYGQTLGEAEFVQAAGNGTFTFVEGNKSDKAIGDEMPQSAGISKYTVKFTPNDNNEKSAWAEIPVLVKPKKITAYAENAEKIYGDNTELSFTVDKSQLVGSDTRDDLGLTLTAGEGDERYCDVGRYEIDEASCSGTNYDVTVIPAELTVKRRPIVISADDRQKIYGQKMPKLTWHMDESQLVGGDSIDEFKLVLTAGEGNHRYCDAGDYDITLRAVGQQNDNYVIEFNNGKLKVEPLMIAFKWNIPKDLKVGDPAPTAEITNLVRPDDDCRLVVKSDGTSNPSWTEGSHELIIYNAEITGLTGTDSANYVLPDEELTRQYLVRRDDPADYNMPKAAVMTYGQTLGEAELILASGDGTFTFVKDDKSHEDIGGTMPPGAGTFKCIVKFTPSDDKYKSQLSEVTVLVKPKKITAYADDVEKTYGDKTSLSYTVDESQLVGSDTKESLGLTLTAVSTEGADKPDGNRIKSPVGTYDIVQKTVDKTRGDFKSNYDVTVIPGILTIHPKEISLIWSDVSNLYYTGNPANVTAKAGGLVKGDTCDVTVVNGDRIEPGTYTALAVSISNSNYILPRDRDQLMKEYTIKAEAPGKPGDGSSDGSGTGSSQKATGARTSDPVSLPLMLALCILTISSGTVITVLLRKNRSK